MAAPTGFVQTVTGPVAAQELGWTLAHEHLLLDIQPPEQRDLPEAPLTLETLGETRRYWGRNPFDSRLEDEADAIAELLAFKAAGGGTVVEVTSIGLRRDPAGLRRIAQGAGVHVVMGCSFYVHHYHPPRVARMDVEALCDEIVGDLREGADGTGIRAGIIGEVGLFWPLHPDEIKVLRASAMAQRETGAALMIHPGRDAACPMAAISIVKESGGDPARCVMAHIDRTLFRREDMLALAATGCTLEFDLFGQESSFYPLAPIDMPNDATRIEHLLALIAAGHRERLLVAHDVCHKHRLRKYGGEGYSHLLENVVPVMRRKGMREEDIEALFVSNPARMLAFG
jgi:phosphotriesterase-related protein